MNLGHSRLTPPYYGGGVWIRGDGDEHRLDGLVHPSHRGGGDDRGSYLAGDAPASAVSFPSPLWDGFWFFGRTPLRDGVVFVSRAPFLGGFWFPGMPLYGATTGLSANAPCPSGPGYYSPDGGPSQGDCPGFVPRSRGY